MNRRLATLLAGLAVTAAAAPSARAGTYDVVSCADPDSHRMAGQTGLPPGWQLNTPDGPDWRSFAGCGSWGGGFGLQTNPVGGSVPYGGWARLTFSPPADTSVAGARVARALRRPSPNAWVVPMLASSSTDWCHTYWDTCTVGDFANPGSSANLANIAGAPYFELYCDGGGGCWRDGVGAWQLFGARLTLNDGNPPAFSGTASGALAGAATLSGLSSVSVVASDRGGGLLAAEVLAGSTVLGRTTFDTNGRCDTSFRSDLVPCPLSGARTVSADTTGVPDGSYDFSLRLTDVAGNRTVQSLGTKTVTNVPPAQPAKPAAYWLDRAGALAYGQRITVPWLPQSGLAGYAVTIDGSAPGKTANLSAAADGSATLAPPAGGWPSGRVTVLARAIAGNGAASAAVGQTVLHVDRSEPVPTAAGHGAPGDWQPAPVSVTLSATDSGSGMGAADDGRPVESGGHIAYTIDDQALRKAAGDTVKVELTEPGRHAITFRAYDVAGNVSADRTVEVAVGTPSEAVQAPGFGFSARVDNPETIFAAAASFASPCPPAAALTPERDASVDQSQPDTPLAAARELSVRSGATANARALLDFPLPSAAGCEVASARLRLHVAAGATGRTLATYRLGSSWDDETTWPTRPGVTGAAATAASRASGWVEFDVTDQVAGIYRYGDSGLLVRDASEGATPAAGQTFDSSEAAADLRPQLLLEFR